MLCRVGATCRVCFVLRRVELSLIDLGWLGLKSVGRANMCERWTGQDGAGWLFSTGHLDAGYARTFAETLNAPAAFDCGDTVAGSSVYHVMPYLATASSELRTLPST
jgi:hypothetical protein